jgi:hypothetical protein
MQIERQDGRTVADQNLRGQVVAIAQAVHGLNGELRKILVPGQILERPALGMGAAGEE